MSESSHTVVLNGAIVPLTPSSKLVTLASNSD